MELDFVDWLRDRLPSDPRLMIGVGDDAALVGLGGRELVATSDLLIDGVHFLTAEHAPERIGRKALAVNLSDLAAMAARPSGALVSLAIPRRGAGGLSPHDLATRLLEGMLPLAEEFACPIVGGDTNTTEGPLVLSVTALGEPTERGAVRRDGAKPGDWLMVTGEGLGGSLRGKHLDFTPRVQEALTLVESTDLHAMMDLSDGLSLDLRRMCSASGVAGVVVADYVICSEAANAGVGETGKSPLDRALSDGEDFELLFAVSAVQGEALLGSSPLLCGLNRIGEVREGQGVFVRALDGTERSLEPAGYEHR